MNPSSDYLKIRTGFKFKMKGYSASEPVSHLPAKIRAELNGIDWLQNIFMQRNLIGIREPSIR
jgi:hypothetical protein